jgi:hypothetical protein
MLAVQAVATDRAGMACFEWAALEGTSSEEGGPFLKTGVKLSGLNLRLGQVLGGHRQVRERAEAIARETGERLRRMLKETAVWQQCTPRRRSGAVGRRPWA